MGKCSGMSLVLFNRYFSHITLMLSGQRRCFFGTTVSFGDTSHCRDSYQSVPFLLVFLKEDLWLMTNSSYFVVLNWPMINTQDILCPKKFWECDKLWRYINSWEFRHSLWSHASSLKAASYPFSHTLSLSQHESTMFLNRHQVLYVVSLRWYYHPSAFTSLTMIQ